MFLINPYILGGGAAVNPLWNDLLAYYTADNTGNDALGNYNGTLTNGATYGTGIINNGFSFDGVNDYVDLGNNLDFDGTTPFSISCFVYHDTSFSTFAHYLSKISYSPSALGYQLNTSSDKIRFYLTALRNGGGYCYVETTNSVLTINTWHHVVMTYDGSQDISGVNIYVDNTSVALSSLGNNLTGSTSNSDNSSIGAGSNGTAYYMRGIIDEVGVWNRELTATEVTELYNSGAAKQYPN